MDHETMQNEPPSQQKKWDVIIEENHNAAKEVLGYVKRTKRTNPSITKLSDQQKKIGVLINASRNEERKLNCVPSETKCSRKSTKLYKMKNIKAS